MCEQESIEHLLYNLEVDNETGITGLNDMNIYEILSRAYDLPEGYFKQKDFYGHISGELLDSLKLKAGREREVQLMI